MAFLDRVAYGRALPAAAVAGILVGLGGVALLAGPAGDGIDLVGALICLGAAFAWAAGSLYTREADLPARPLVGAGMQMLAGGVLLTIAGIATGELGQVDLGAVSLRSSLALAYLVVFGSILAFSCYIWLLKAAPTSLVSTYAYVNPVVAVALGAVFLSEPITARTIVAGLAIVAAVALIVTARSRPAEARKPLPETAELRRRSRRRHQDARALTARPSAPLTERADGAQRL
jgi:drug/metabolite transporter (DMT)-like permease